MAAHDDSVETPECRLVSPFSASGIAGESEKTSRCVFITRRKGDLDKAEILKKIEPV